MPDSLEACLANLPLSRLAGAAQEIREALADEQALRLGQSTVVSTKVHAFDAHKPEHVQILITADAGRIFYQRSDMGAICHLDIFHACGEVDHRLAAGYIRKAVALYRQLAAAQPLVWAAGVIEADTIDIQTATGGGRITGSLNGGQKASLRRAHENHVHIALLRPENDLGCLFYIAAAVETAILGVGLELRCNERISYVDSGDGQTDLSPYTDQSDSRLGGQPPATGTLELVPDAAEQQAQQAKELLTDCRCQKAPTGFAGQAAKGSRGQILVGADGGKPVKRLTTAPQTQQTAVSDWRSWYAPGLYDSLKTAVGSLPNKAGCRQTKREGRYCDTGRQEMFSGSCARSGTIEVTATVTAAAERFLSQSLTGRLHIGATDLRFSGHVKQPSYDICFLVDTSASMTGPWLQAARYLTGEISRFGGRRFSLITFQDSQASVIRPFTTSRQTLLNSFAEMAPHGATPLALGLKQALAFLAGQQVKKPLLVLITDGIPSRCYGENSNPLTEALQMAGAVKQTDCRFLCVGLDRDNSFLIRLTAAADGVFYPFTKF